MTESDRHLKLIIKLNGMVGFLVGALRGIMFHDISDETKDVIDDVLAKIREMEKAE